MGGIVSFVGFAVASQAADDQWLATYNQFVSTTTSPPASSAAATPPPGLRCRSSRALPSCRAWDWGDYGDFASGGWRFGNVDLEVIGVTHDSPIAPYLSDRFVTLDPTSTNGLVAKLARRGLACPPQAPQLDGHGKELYTCYELTDLSDRFVVQLCACGIGGLAGHTLTRPARRSGGRWARTL